MAKKNINNLFVNFFVFLCVITALRIPYIYNTKNELLPFLNTINLISFFISLLMIKKISIKNFGFLMLIYYLIIAFSSYQNNLDFLKIFIDFFLLISPIILISCFSKKEFDNSISIILFAFEMLAYINFIVILLFPEGLYNIGLERKYYFLGHVNVAIRYLLPGSCLSIVYSLNKYNKLSFRSILFICCTILTILITWSATSIAGYTVFLCSYMIMLNHKKIAKIINPFSSYLIGLITTYLIVIVGIQSKFNALIVNILHRDLTFTGRTVIWSNALKYIYNKPLIGYGRQPEEYKRLIFNGAANAHNQYLSILFEGGIIALVFAFIIFFILKKQIRKCENHKIVSILSAAMLSYAIMWCFEPFSYSGTFCMLLLYVLIYKSNVFFCKTGDEDI